MMSSIYRINTLAMMSDFEIIITGIIQRVLRKAQSFVINDICFARADRFIPLWLAAIFQTRSAKLREQRLESCLLQFRLVFGKLIH